MTAPGENLDFKEGVFFKSKAKGRKDLQDAVLAAIKNRPRQGKVVAGSVRELDFIHSGKPWTILYSLKGTDVGLLNVFGPGEEEYLEAYKEDLCGLFGKEGGR